MDEPVHTDVSLIARIAQRDAEALTAFYTRYGKHVFSLALAMLGDHARASDLTQEVFLLVWRAAGTYRPTGSPRAWLLRLTRNRVIDELRQQRRRFPSPDTSPASVLPAVLMRLESTDAGERHELRQAVQTLPEAQREALVLAFFLGYSHQEIATRLQVPVGTVKARIRRALLALRQHFEDKQDLT